MFNALAQKAQQALLVCLHIGIHDEDQFPSMQPLGNGRRKADVWPSQLSIQATPAGDKTDLLKTFQRHKVNTSCRHDVSSTPGIQKLFAMHKGNPSRSPKFRKEVLQL